MKCLISTTLLLSFCIQSIAQETDYIYSDYEMKDGSVYTGYISRQSFTDKSVTLSTVSALKVMDESDVSIDPTLSITPISALEDEMRNWLKKHSNILPDSSSKSTVPITVVEDRKNQHTYRNALLVQRGEKVKFITCENVDVDVKADDIVKLTKTVRPAGIFSGVNERFSTKRYEDDLNGQVVCQDMTNGTIYILGDKGYQFNIKNSDIISRSEILIDSELPYNEQCPFIETVHTKDGTYCGFISKQVFGTKDIPGYLLVQTALNQVDRVEYSDITEIRRRPNEQYKPVILPVIAEDEYYVCDTIAYPCNLSKINGKEVEYCVNENKDSTKTHIILDKNSVLNGLKVQIKSNPNNKNIILVPLKSVDKYLVKKYNSKYSFNLNDEIFARESYTKHGIDTYIYKIEPSIGHFVIFRKDMLQAVWIEIK